MTPEKNIRSSFCRNVSSPLSKNGERVKGIEPSSSAWKAVALPLSYTRAAASHQGLAASHIRSLPGKASLGKTTSQAPDLNGGGGRTRTCEAMRRLIYSQLPLPLGTLPPDPRRAYLRHGNELGKWGPPHDRHDW
jgi:hypothetical protein